MFQRSRPSDRLPGSRPRAPGPGAAASPLGALQQAADTSPGARQLQRLQRAADRMTATRTPAIQRESSYDGLMPAHDVAGDSYTHKGVKSDKFTYHHIIPENILKNVTRELEAIKRHLAAPGAGGAEKVGFDEALGGLTGNARAQWLGVRAKNFAFFANKEYTDYGITISEAEARQVMEGNGRDRDAMFQAFRELYRGKIRPKFDARKGSAIKNNKELLRSHDFYRQLQTEDEGGIQATLQGVKDVAIFDLAALMRDLMPKIRAANASPPRRGSNRAAYEAALIAAMRAQGFDAHFPVHYPPLHDNRIGAGTLKKLVQDYAMPHDEASELEHSVQWNPGNIHRGPSSSYRLNPENGDTFDPLLDDGGDTFEKAAANLLGTEHFTKLAAVAKEIDAFLKIQADEADATAYAGKVRAATTLVNHMVEIQGFGLTAFDESQWTDDDKTKKMRLKPEVGKLQSVGEWIPPFRFDAPD